MEQLESRKPNLRCVVDYEGVYNAGLKYESAGRHLSEPQMLVIKAKTDYPVAARGRVGMTADNIGHSERGQPRNRARRTDFNDVPLSLCSVQTRSLSRGCLAIDLNAAGQLDLSLRLSDLCASRVLSANARAISLVNQVWYYVVVSVRRAINTIALFGS